MTENDRPEVSDMVETVSAVGGALAGTALTLAAGPFVGSASGEAVARVLARVASAIEQRFFAPRQQQRLVRRTARLPRQRVRSLRLDD